MGREDLILLEQLCGWYNIEPAFVESLEEIGLVEVVVIDEKRWLEKSHVSEFEKMARLHSDLGINAEGIEAIRYLLKRVEELQDEVRILKRNI